MQILLKSSFIIKKWSERIKLLFRIDDKEVSFRKMTGTSMTKTCNADLSLWLTWLSVRHQYVVWFSSIGYYTTASHGNFHWDFYFFFCYFYSSDQNIFSLFLTWQWPTITWTCFLYKIWFMNLDSFLGSPSFVPNYMLSAFVIPLRQSPILDSILTNSTVWWQGRHLTNWHDKVQPHVISLMEKHEKNLPSFKKFTAFFF